MRTITNLWNSFKYNLKMKQNIKYHNTLTQESNSAIQLMEFDGAIYLSHHGTPVLPVTSLRCEAVDAVSQSRKAWVDYHMKEKNLSVSHNFQLTKSN